VPAKAQQSRTLDPEKNGFQNHLVRLRQRNTHFTVGASVPEILVKNNHCRSGAFQLRMGVYRLVCANGMVVGDDYGKFSVRHGGFASSQVEEAARAFANNAPRILCTIEKWQTLSLNEGQKLEFAREAIELKFNEKENAYALSPESIVRPKRRDDANNDLWSVFNVAQERLVKGGVYGRTSDGKVRKDRAITNIDRDLRFNRDLWNLAERYATQLA
jgi:hypothetical protein